MLQFRLFALDCEGGGEEELGMAPHAVQLTFRLAETGAAEPEP